MYPSDLNVMADIGFPKTAQRIHDAILKIPHLWRPVDELLEMPYHRLAFSFLVRIDPDHAKDGTHPFKVVNGVWIKHNYKSEHITHYIELNKLTSPL